MSYLDSFDLIHNSQSGFRAGHSTETALLLMTERWLKALNDGKVVGSVMVDFRKAFDLVDHTLLLEKLSCYKVSDRFLHLMQSYLDDRTQVVSVNNKQKSLIVLRKWCKQNGMLLNTDKTKVMLITTRQKRLHINENILSLSYNDVELQITTGDKILGVNIDENLVWNNHYQFVCKKVSSYIWLLSRISHFLSTEHKLLYYKSYIQSHFNYCNVIWGNASNFNVARITRLQRRACKIILGNEYIDFESAKSSLKILSFEQSVFLNKAKVMFKVANGLVPQYISDKFKRRSEIAQNTSLRSITNENFTIPKPSLALYKENISYSGPVVWNSIPNEIKHSLSISSFSDNVKTWIMSS